VLGNPPDASAVAVEVLSDFLMNEVHLVNNPRAIFSYLRIMTARRALKLREKMNPYTPIESMEIGEDTRDPEELAHLVSLMPHLDTCLGKLTPKAQKVLRLKYHRGMPHERIGELVGGSKQYIGRLVTKSIALLRECMTKALSGSDGTREAGGIQI